MSEGNLSEMEERLRTQRENLKRERVILLAVLSKLFPSMLAHHSPDESGSDYDWGYVVYIQLPTGQVSFHIGESRQWFEHVKLSNIPVWDGHDSDVKWQRVVDFLNA